MMNTNVVTQFDQAWANLFPNGIDQLPALAQRQIAEDQDILSALFRSLNELSRDNYFAYTSLPIRSVHAKYATGPHHCCREQRPHLAFKSYMAAVHSHLAMVYIAHDWNECKTTARRVRKVEETFQRWINKIKTESNVLKVVAHPQSTASSSYNLSLGFNLPTLFKHGFIPRDDQIQMCQLELDGQNPITAFIDNVKARGDINTDLSLISKN